MSNLTHSYIGILTSHMTIKREREPVTTGEKPIDEAQLRKPSSRESKIVLVHSRTIEKYVNIEKEILAHKSTRILGPTQPCILAENHSTRVKNWPIIRPEFLVELSLASWSNIRMKNWPII